MLNEDGLEKFTDILKPDQQNAQFINYKRFMAK